ncbi:hypothetical protein [Nocardiopsis sp. CA-288880]
MLRYFLLDLAPASLSPRNLRACAEIACPDDVAAEIVGRLRRH